MMEWLPLLLLLWLLLLLGWTGLDLGLLWLGFLHLPGQTIFQLRIGIPFTIADTCSICEDFYFSVPCVCIGGWCSSCQYWGYFLGVCEDMEAFCQAFLACYCRVKEDLSVLLFRCLISQFLHAG